MKLIDVGPDPLGEYPRRVVVEYGNGERHTWVGDVLCWTDEATGKEPPIGLTLEIGPLLWLHDREQLRKRKAAEAHENSGLGVDDPHPEAWRIGQKPRTDGTHAVHLGPGVQAALVEALAPMHVWGTHASGRPLAAGERFVWVDREASTEGLRQIGQAILDELTRRERGE